MHPAFLRAASHRTSLQKAANPQTLENTGIAGLAYDVAIPDGIASFYFIAGRRKIFPGNRFYNETCSDSPGDYA